MNQNFFQRHYAPYAASHPRSDANAHSKDKDIERLWKLKKDDEITQTAYDRELSAIQPLC